MTVSTEVSRNDYIGGGPDLPFNFRVFEATDLKVVKVVVATGVESDLVLDTDYSVTGVGDAEGSITLIDAGVAADLLAGDIHVSIIRNMELVQPTDIRNLGDFLPEVHEDEFDRIVMQLQQQKDDLKRSYKLPKTEAGSDALTIVPGLAQRAGLLFAWDGQGRPTAVANAIPSGSITLSSFFLSWLTTTLPAFMQAFLTSLTGADALGTLGVSTFMQDFLTKTTAALARTKLGFGTAAKFIVQGDLATLSVGTPELKDAAVTGVKIAEATITGDKLAAMVQTSANNLLLAWTSIHQVTISFNELGLREFMISGIPPAMVDIQNSGLNGLDTGSEQASKWYSIWAICKKDGSGFGYLLSLSVSAPTMPTGYAGSLGRKRLIGFVYNDAGSNFEPFRIRDGWFQNLSQTVYTQPVSLVPNAWQTMTINPASSPNIETELLLGSTLYGGRAAGAEIYVRLWLRQAGSGQASKIPGGFCNSGNNSLNGTVEYQEIRFPQLVGRQLQYFFLLGVWNGPSWSFDVLGFKIPSL